MGKGRALTTVLRSNTFMAEEQQQQQQQQLTTRQAMFLRSKRLVGGGRRQDFPSLLFLICMVQRSPGPLFRGSEMKTLNIPRTDN